MQSAQDLNSVGDIDACLMEAIFLINAAEKGYISPEDAEKVRAAWAATDYSNVMHHA